MKQSCYLLLAVAAFALTTTTLPVLADHHKTIANIVDHHLDFNVIAEKEVKDASTSKVSDRYIERYIAMVRHPDRLVAPYMMETLLLAASQ